MLGTVETTYSHVDLMFILPVNRIFGGAIDIPPFTFHTGAPINPESKVCTILEWPADYTADPTRLQMKGSGSVGGDDLETSHPFAQDAMNLY